jgi:hypothetical protein
LSDTVLPFTGHTADFPQGQGKSQVNVKDELGHAFSASTDSPDNTRSRPCRSKSQHEHPTTVTFWNDQLLDDALIRQAVYCAVRTVTLCDQTPINAEARVQYQVSLCEIFDAQTGTGQGFLPVLLFPPVSIIPPTIHTISSYTCCLCQKDERPRAGNLQKAILFRNLDSTALKRGFTVSPLLFTTSKYSIMGNGSSQTFTGAISGIVAYRRYIGDCCIQALYRGLLHTGAVSGTVAYRRYIGDCCIQIRLIFVFKGFSTVSTPHTFAVQRWNNH